MLSPKILRRTKRGRKEERNHWDDRDRGAAGATAATGTTQSRESLRRAGKKAGLRSGPKAVRCVRCKKDCAVYIPNGDSAE